MITITDNARRMLHRQGAGETSFVRILVKTGGCAGMTYDAEIDNTLRQGESVFQEEGGLTIVSNQESQPFLDGLKIDYSTDLISAGFRFSNSSNESSCGCGASFALSGFPTFAKGGVSCGS